MVGGEDLTAETYLPFNGMRALSRNLTPIQPRVPLIKRGMGLWAPEVAMVLENKEDAVKRGANIYAELVNWGRPPMGTTSPCRIRKAAD